ncbi:MAG: VOC family protein [Phenylobacterium sp.]|uniref:VOC family protein n=1 Tax=Phenylobacterium sp. TaxID=1871053 RepID=UPI001A5A90F5|nr:VOC family protein [Phenylobacterium sp.]MBL8771731.1 VOC family protein [Phenylobacterium sp.]
MGALTYCTVGSNRLEDAKAFYDALLSLAGLEPIFEHPTGGRVYGTAAGPNFGVLGPFDGRPATVGNGSMFAFIFDTREDVERFHAKGLELGGACEGLPGVRGGGLYLAYFRDLDGNKLCAYAMPGAPIRRRSPSEH